MLFYNQLLNSDNMAQSFIPINEDKEEYYRAYDIGGLSMIEQWIEDFNESGTIALLLMDRWKSNKVAFVGDYDAGLFYTAENTYKDIADIVNKLKEEKLNEFIQSKDKYAVVNETDKTFVVGSPKQISIMLIVLLRQTCEIGGSNIYLYVSKEIAGMFAGKNIFVSKKSEFNDNGYKDITKYVIGPSMKFYKS